MHEMLQAIAQNPIVSLVSLVLGFFGVLLAILFYLKSRRFKALRYDVIARTIVEDLTAELDGLEVRYQNAPQERITVSRVLLWNCGTDTVTAADLTDADPLRLEIPNGADLLDSRIVFQTDESNQVTLARPELDTQKTARLNITLDYLDRFDGVEIQLVHTGPRRHPVKVHGKVKGAQKIDKLEPSSAPELPWPFRGLVRPRVVGWFGGLFYLFFCITSLLGFLRNFHRWYLLFVTAFTGFAAWVMFMVYVRRSLPRKFKDHRD